MKKLKQTIFGATPKVAVSVTDRESDRKIKSLPVDILELRVDSFRRLDPDYVKNVIALRRKIGPPLILTVRSKEEGGQKNISDALKLRIFKDSISLVDVVDIELKSPILSEVRKIARKNKKLIIISWHNFRSTPSDKVLENILSRAKRSGADLVKVAVKANKMGDVYRLMKFTVKNRSKNLITISLGSIGSISRLTFPAIGSLVTYAYIDKPSGPGQISLGKLLKLLRSYYPKKK